MVMLPSDRMEFYQMEIVANGALHVIFGIIACFVSIAMFLQPLPTFWRIIFSKDTRGILPYPFLAAAFNCLYWLHYASPITGNVIHFHAFCLCCSCSVGSIMMDLYVFIFWNRCKQINRFKLCLVVIIINVATFFFLPWKALLLEHRNSIVGPFVVISGTMFYASPIFTIFEALRTKRAESLPFGFLAVSCLNGLVWTIYTTCLPSNFDIPVVITNGVGTILSIAQLGLAYEVQSIIGAIGTVQKTTDCNARDGENSKFMHDASTPLLNNVSQPKTHVTEDTVVSEVHPSSRLMLNEVVEENEDTKQQENGMVDDGLEIEIKCNGLSLPSRSSFPRDRPMDHNLEAKINEAGLPAVMSRPDCQR